MIGSGKTNNLRHALSCLSLTSKMSRKQSALPLTSEKVSAICQLLEAFGNSKTIMNSNATRFTQLFSIDYDVGGHIVSASVQVIDGLPFIRWNLRQFYLFFQGNDAWEEKGGPPSRGRAKLQHFLFNVIWIGSKSQKRAEFRKFGRSKSFLSPTSKGKLKNFKGINNVDHPFQLYLHKKSVIMGYVPFQTKDLDWLNCLFMANALFYMFSPISWFA